MNYESVTGTITYEVYDMEGKKLVSLQQPVATGQRNSYQMNITALQPGTYLLKAKGAKDIVSEVKFVKASR